MSYIKYIKRQDCGWKQSPGNSGETSINLSFEITDYLTFGLVDEGEEIPISFRIYKQDFVNAFNFIISQLPLYRTTSREYKQLDIKNGYLGKIKKSIDIFFKDEEFRNYSVVLFFRKDKRIYLKGLTQEGFSIRNFLVENASALSFDNQDGIIELRVHSSITEEE